MATGQTLNSGRYVVTQSLGEGGQGSTLEAIDKTDGSLVAIKCYRVRGAKSWKEVELAEREARVLASVNHPALPRYFNQFEDDGSLCLVMERIEGQSLDRIKGLSQSDVIELLRQAGELLDYLHERAPPLIHRDLKPKNILRDKDGRYRFVDFGSVRDRLRPEGGSTVVGTFGFMAPEQLQGRALPATDVYAMGATALFLLTGVPPEQLPHRGLAIDVDAALGGNVRPGLVRVLKRMLEPDPDKRATRILPLLAEASAPGAGSPPRQRGSRRVADAGAWQTRPARGVRPRLPWPLLMALWMALFAARVAIWGLMEVFLPIVLSVASIVIGPKARYAARVCRHVGWRGRRGLSRAAWRLRGFSELEVEAKDAHAPQRPRVRIVTDEELDDDWPLTEERSRPARSTR